MIQVKLGPWGTGKTNAAIREMTALAKEKKRVLLFVPDQFSFETERLMYTAAGAENIRYIKVTSFARIAREILTKYRRVRPYADETVKLVTMLDAVRGLKGSLDHFGEGAEKTGFAAQMLKTVAGFKNAGITSDELKRALNTQTGLADGLLGKASDIQLIYEAYDKALTAVLDDKLDDVSRSAALAEEKGFFADYSCFFDNFDSFSGTQLKLLEVIGKSARQTTICLSEGSRKSARTIERTLMRLEKISQRVEIKKYSGQRPPVPIKMISAKSPFSEADYIAAEISRLVREEKLRYRDILVLTPSPSYEQALAASFQRCGIPAFFDFPLPLTAKPAVKYILSLLEAVEFRPDRLMAYLRSGFVRVRREDGKAPTRLLSSAEINRLEEMAAEYRFGAGQWLKPVYETLPRKAPRGSQEGWERRLQKLETLRLSVITPLQELNERLCGCENGRTFTEILVRFLTEEQALKSTFLARSKSGGGEGTDYLKLSRESMDEYGKLWDKLTGVFDSLAYCMDKGAVSVSRYREILENVLTGMTLAKPPAVLDCVTVGDTERTRRSGVKALFVCGAWEGALPRRSSSAGMFTADEQEGLAAQGIELEETGALRRAKELYYAERSLALPEKQLAVSCPQSDFSGLERQFALMLGGYEAAEEITAEELPAEFYAVTSGSVRALAAACFDENREAFEKLAALTPENGGFYRKLEEAARLAAGKTRQKIPPELAKRLYTDVYSPTRLDSAFTCAFQHFCKYGLGLRQKDDSDILSPARVGTIVHEVLQLLARSGCFTDEAAEPEQAVDAALEKEACLLEKQGHHDTDKTDALLQRLKPRLVKLAENIRLELEETGFEPRFFEEKLSYSAHGTTISGIADRIDEKEENGAVYARICDYKTGKKEMDLFSVWNGLDLQMLLYLFAYCDKTGAKWGAVEYMPSGAEPAYRGSRGDYDEKQSCGNWQDSHKPSGVVVTDTPAQTGIASYQKRLRLLAGTTPAKSFVNAEELSEKQLERLRRHIEDELILKRVGQFMDGDISPLPFIPDENRNPCGYCPFGGFCTNKDGAEEVRQGENIPDDFFEQDEI